MATLKILAGDLPKCKASVTIGKEAITITIPWQPGDGWSTGQQHHFHKTEIQEIAAASEENVKRLGGTVGWGAAGAALFGPVGLLAGLVLGGKGKEVTFIMLLHDGKKIMATTDSKTYTQLQALVF